MRDSAAGVERDRAVALARRAPRPLDGCLGHREDPRAAMYGGRTDDDAGEHGFGRCCVCTEDFLRISGTWSDPCTAGRPVRRRQPPPTRLIRLTVRTLALLRLRRNCDGHHSMTRCLLLLCQRARRT